MFGGLDREHCEREDCEVRRIAAELQQEICERRRIEERLADAQRIAHIGHWDWTITTNELSWSDEIYRIFGLPPQEFGATYDAFLELVHPQDRDSVIQAVNRAVLGNAAYSIDYRIVRPDGEVRIVHAQAEVSFDEQAKARRMLGTVQDVTESRLVGLELERKEEMLRGVLEALPVGVWIADETGRVTTTNRTAAEIWGAAPHLGLSEYDSYRAWDLRSGERLRSEDWALARSLLTGKPYIGQEVRIETFDGRTRVLRVWGAPVLDARGKITGAICVAEDITSHFVAKQALSSLGEELRKLTQHQIRIREQEKAAIARELHEGIGQMLSGALMQVASVRCDVSGLAEVALKCGTLEAVLKEVIESIRRLSSELRPPILDHFGLEDALDWLATESRKTSGIACAVSIDGKMPDGDDVRSLELFRICQEAIYNSIRSKAQQVTVSVREQGSGICLEVTDDGARDSSECDATIALAIIGMRERATEMSGTFELKTDPMQGTVVSVWIPTPAGDSEMKHSSSLA